VILVDTSVWIDHFRRFNQSLYDLLIEGKILSHPFIVGELACGYLPDRAEILSLMQNLPAAEISEHDVVLTLVERKHLLGTGIGWIDAHLLASSMVMGCGLWSIDKPLAKAALKMGIAAPSKTVP
jgi:predicted nucleic acid-binding protein